MSEQNDARPGRRRKRLLSAEEKLGSRPCDATEPLSLRARAGLNAGAHATAGRRRRWGHRRLGRSLRTGREPPPVRRERAAAACRSAR